MLALQLLGSLGLLIYGMRMMSEALQKMAGPQLRHVLAKMTTNRLTGMLTGTLVTCAVQSSSATTVMTVSFVSAGLLTLAQAISIIMGANIGTTLTAWIMSVGYNVDLTTIVYPAFLVGMMLIYKKRHRYMGDLLFGLAFLFLSLVMLSSTGKSLDLAHNEAVVGFFASFDVSSHLTIFAFVAIGTLITCIVQSSAAVMAITILLCSTGVLPIYLGIALVMGENIGTTATANLVALGSNTQDRRAALAHLLFNVFGVIWVLIVFYPFVNMVCGLVGYEIQATLSSTEGDTIASVAKTTEAHSGAVGGGLGHVPHLFQRHQHVHSHLAGAATGACGMLDIARETGGQAERRVPSAIHPCKLGADTGNLRSSGSEGNCRFRPARQQDVRPGAHAVP